METNTPYTYRTCDETPGMDQTIGQAVKRWAPTLAGILAMAAIAIFFTELFFRLLVVVILTSAVALLFGMAVNKTKYGRGSRVQYWVGLALVSLVAAKMAGLMG